MKTTLFTAILFLSSNLVQASPICQEVAIKTAKTILAAEGEVPGFHRVALATSEKVGEENYLDETFHIEIKTKTADRCVTLNYFGSADSGCMLFQYRGIGCH